MIDKELFKLLGNNKKYIFIAVVLQCVGLILNVTITACVCYAIKLTVYGGEWTYYIYTLCVAVVAVLLRYGCTRLVGDVKDRLGRSVKKDLRRKLFDKLIKLGVRSTDDMSMAGLTQVGVEGVEQLDLYYSSYLPQFFYAVLAPLILFLICVWIDWRTSLVLLACVPLIPLSIIAVSKYAKRIFAKYWGKYTSMGDKFLDSVQGLKELKIFQADQFQHERMNENAEEFRKITMKVLIMQLASTTIMDLIAYGGAGAGIALCICGAAFWGLNPINALFLCLVAVEFFLPLRAFGSAFHVAMNGVSAGKKLIELFDKPEPVWGSCVVDGCDINICDVNFSYDRERNVLKNVSASFDGSGMTAIVGASGCGKSTLVKMLTGAITPDSGSVTVGNTSINDLSRENWYSKLAVISYNSYVFNCSIRENFKMANNAVTDEQIYDALNKVNLRSLVDENGGLDMVICEDGSNISGGQKQRLTLAVALIANKDIYVFDEATSNVDIESEAVIMDNVRELAKTKSVIVISHRLANVVSSQKIYYMSDGQIEECGTHDELMQKRGGYYELFTTQKRLEEGYCNG